jgi:hypothetical protein
MKLKPQGPSLARASCKALGGALGEALEGALHNVLLLYLNFIRNFLFFYNKDPKILPASDPTKHEYALAVNEILVMLREVFS